MDEFLKFNAHNYTKQNILLLHLLPKQVIQTKRRAHKQWPMVSKPDLSHGFDSFMKNGPNVINMKTMMQVSHPKNK